MLKKHLYFSVIITILISQLFFSCEGLLSGTVSSSEQETDSGQPDIVQSWGQDAVLDMEDGYVWDPQIEYNSSGQAVAIWCQQAQDHTRRIMVRHYNGSSWENVVIIDDQSGDNRGNCFRPQISFSDSGNAMAVWNQNIVSEGKNHIYASYYNGSSWNSPNRIDISTTDVSFPKVAINNNKAVAIWQEGTFTHESIYAAYYDNGTWGVAEALEVENDNQAYNHSVVINEAGKAIAVWEQKKDELFNIYYNIYEGNSWSDVEYIETDDVNRATYPAISMNSSGNAMVIWSQASGGLPAIKSRFYNGSSFGSEELVTSESTISYANNGITLNDKGQAALVFLCMGGSGTEACISKYNGASWNTSEIVIESVSSIVQMDMDMDEEGRILLVWQQSELDVDGNTQFSIWSKNFDGNDWYDSTLLESDDSNTATNPQIAISSTGEGIAVWEQDNGSVKDIRMNHYK